MEVDQETHETQTLTDRCYAHARDVSIRLREEFPESYSPEVMTHQGDFLRASGIVCFFIEMGYLDKATRWKRCEMQLFKAFKVYGSFNVLLGDIFYDSFIQELRSNIGIIDEEIVDEVVQSIHNARSFEDLFHKDHVQLAKVKAAGFQSSNELAKKAIGDIFIKYTIIAGFRLMLQDQQRHNPAVIDIATLILHTRLFIESHEATQPIEIPHLPKWERAEVLRMQSRCSITQDMICREVTKVHYPRQYERLNQVARAENRSIDPTLLVYILYTLTVDSTIRVARVLAENPQVGHTIQPKSERQLVVLEQLFGRDFLHEIHCLYYGFPKALMFFGHQAFKSTNALPFEVRSNQAFALAFELLYPQVVENAERLWIDALGIESTPELLPKTRTEIADLLKDLVPRLVTEFWQEKLQDPRYIARLIDVGVVDASWSSTARTGNASLCIQSPGERVQKSPFSLKKKVDGGRNIANQEILARLADAIAKPHIWGRMTEDYVFDLFTVTVTLPQPLSDIRLVDNRGGVPFFITDLINFLIEKSNGRIIAGGVDISHLDSRTFSFIQFALVGSYKDRLYPFELRINQDAVISRKTHLTYKQPVRWLVFQLLDTALFTAYQQDGRYSYTRRTLDDLFQNQFERIKAMIGASSTVTPKVIALMSESELRRIALSLFRQSEVSYIEEFLSVLKTGLDIIEKGHSPAERNELSQQKEYISPFHRLISTLFAFSIIDIEHIAALVRLEVVNAPSYQEFPEVHYFLGLLRSGNFDVERLQQIRPFIEDTLLQILQRAGMLEPR